MPTPDPVPLSTAIRRPLNALLSRWRLYVVIEAVAVMLTAWAIGFALFVTADYLLRLGRATRAVLLAPLLAGLVLLLLRRLAPALRRPLDPADAAHLVERANPELHTLLVSAVRFSRGQFGSSTAHSPELVRSVIRQANEHLTDLPISSLLRHRRAVVSCVVIIWIGACLGLWQRTCAASLSLALRRVFLLSKEEWPKRTHLVLDVEGNRMVAATGDDLEIRARVEGVMPRHVDVVFDTDEGVRGTHPMTWVGNSEVRHTFINLQRPLRFRLQGGDDRTRQIEVVLSERPRVASAVIHITPPAYSGLDRMTLPPAQRTLRALAGSVIEIDLATSKPVASAEWFVDNRSLGELEGQGEHWRARIEVATSASYHVLLTDPEGLSSRRPERFVLRRLPDEAPTIRLMMTGIGEQITPEAVLRIRIEAGDDFGLAGVRLEAALAGAPDEPDPPELPPLAPRTRSYETSLDWPLAAVGLAPGDMLTLAAYAADLNDVSGPGETRSLPITLRVVSREQLQAELARREQEIRAEFQRLIDQQEDLRRQLLTAADRLSPNSSASARTERLAPLERRQRSLSSAVASIARQVERLIGELRANGLNEFGISERMEADIAQPLNRLATIRTPDAAEHIRRWNAEGSEASRSAVDPAQAAILQDMHDILSKMRRSEGYHDVVTLLQDIIRLQKELNQETRQKAQADAADIFDD